MVTVRCLPAQALREGHWLLLDEVNLAAALDGLKLSMPQFIDLCILCGCDYTDSIKGIGPITALKLIQEHGNIEGVLKIEEEVGNKKVYDPRSYLKKAEQSLCDRLKRACDDLLSTGKSIYQS